jgi:subfamily B ATP-binding cassette protein HlyB/CyaB
VACGAHVTRLDGAEKHAMTSLLKQPIASGRTVFIVAHRLSTIRFTDRILTLDRGRLIEDGTHDDLIWTGGRYANLYRLQSGIHEIR